MYEDFSNDKEMFDFNNYLARSKCHDNSNKLVVGKMEDKQLCCDWIICWIKAKGVFVFGRWS